MTLGGWQRLWILVSVIWLLPVALGTLHFMQEITEPEGSQYLRLRYQATLDLLEKEASLKLKLTDGSIIMDVPKGISKEDLEQLYARHLKRDQELSAMRKKSPSMKLILGFDSLVRADAEPGDSWPRYRRSSIPPDPTLAAAQLQRLQEDYGKWLDFSEVDSTAKNNMRVLRRELRWKKAMIGVVGFLFWLASIGLLYLLGASIGWVIRGFRDR